MTTPIPQVAEPGSSLMRGHTVPRPWAPAASSPSRRPQHHKQGFPIMPFTESPKSLARELPEDALTEGHSSQTHSNPSDPDYHTFGSPHPLIQGELPPHERLSSFAAPRRPLSPSSDCSHQSGVPTNAVNYLYVVQKKHSSISGNWTVCPSLPVPWSYYLRSENLRLEASSFVAAKVDVIGDTEGKAYIGVESRHNGVYAEVRERGKQKFRLRAYACQDVRIRIPRDFAGPVTLYHRHGYASTSYSPDIYSNFRLLDSTEKETTGWIGAGYEQQSLLGWEGDELIVWSKKGHISLFYGDEA
ncbi:hypothetical protein FRC03_009175 [Tulasnella sp. 419]|nr:hypothetical protein FRC03_009175 [Tulasnella sp. 419]